MACEPVIPLVRHILNHAQDYQWSLQGLGMLRLYLPGNTRLHVWDTRHAYPGVSCMHDHLQWGLTSTIVCGKLLNMRYKEGGELGTPYNMMHIQAGFDTKKRGEVTQINLLRQPAECYGPGDEYHQEPNEIHSTRAVWGTVTIMQQQRTETDGARVFWPIGKEWGNAKPREADAAEIEKITKYALKRLELEADENEWANKDALFY